MKVKEYFVKRKEQAKIQDEGFDKFLESLKDETELPDPVFQLLETNFLTRDRAVTDPAVFGKAKAEIFNALDVKISELYPLVSTEDAQKIGDEKDTYKKIQMVKSSLTSAMEKAKKHDPDSAKQIEESKKQITELTEKFTTLNTKYEADLKAKDEQNSKNLTSAKLQYDVLGRINSVELAKEFAEDPKRKESVVKLIMSDILANNPNYDTNGHLAVFEDAEATKPKFSGNSVITFDKVLEDAVKPFVKRNNVDGKDKKQAPTRKEQVPSANPTLREWQLAESRG